jgi:hypothetical protein
MVALSPIERKAALMAAVTLRESTKTAAAEELDVSWTHQLGVLDGTRPSSAELRARIAAYIGISVDRLFPGIAA